MQVKNSRDFFDSNPKALEEVVSTVRSGFGKALTSEDIYNHLVKPEILCLYQAEDKILGMGSYTRRKLQGGVGYLIVDGVALSPEIQGRGIFSEITKEILDGSEIYACIRTQNPIMMRALEKICTETIHAKEDLKGEIAEVRKDLIDYFGSEVNRDGIVRKHYGGLFYGKKPHHEKIDPLFEKLGLNQDEGDAILAIGRLRNSINS